MDDEVGSGGGLCVTLCAHGIADTSRRTREELAAAEVGLGSHVRNSARSTGRCGAASQV
jgi:hypothetical protein